jgi:hypothetical protein
MALTYDSIQSYSATGSQNQITFSSIPQTFTDLVLVCNVRGSVNQEDLQACLNTDDFTQTNYYFVQLTSVGTTLAGAGYLAGNQTSFRLGDYLPNATNHGGTETHFLSYSNTNVKKTILTTSFNTNATQQMSCLYNSTSAINNIKIRLGAIGNFAAGSTFTLYGIKGA